MKFINVAGKKTLTMSRNTKGANMNKFIYGKSKRGK